jgi:hypothetical protein
MSATVASLVTGDGPASLARLIFEALIAGFTLSFAIHVLHLI